MSLRTLRAWFEGIRPNRNGHDSYEPLPYARISTEDQNLDLQTAALESTGAARIFTDKTSGTRTDRPGLQEALLSCQGRDTFMVWELDRLRRGVKGLVDLVEDL